jgi:hypothetical protein
MMDRFDGKTEGFNLVILHQLPFPEIPGAGPGDTVACCRHSHPVYPWIGIFAARIE